MNRLHQPLHQNKRKVALAPVRSFGWESVLECASFELELARAKGDRKRIEPLAESIKIVKHKIKCGEVFPLGLMLLVWRECVGVEPTNDLNDRSAVLKTVPTTGQEALPEEV